MLSGIVLGSSHTEWRCETVGEILGVWEEAEGRLPSISVRQLEPANEPQIEAPNEDDDD